MIEDLQKFREELFDDYAHIGEDGVLLGKNGNRLYKECKMEELPLKFQESIKEHLKTKAGMGAGLIFDDGKFLFSNTANASLHKCFKKVNNIPEFQMKINDLSFENVKKIIEDNNLKVNCIIKDVDKEDVTGYIKIFLNFQVFFEKNNSTGIEEMDEYFFCKGDIKKTLLLEFRYKEPIALEDKELREKVILMFNQGKQIFAKKWFVVK